MSSRVHAVGGGEVHTAYATPVQATEENAATVSEAPSPIMLIEPPHATVQAPLPLRDTSAVTTGAPKPRLC